MHIRAATFVAVFRVHNTVTPWAKRTVAETAGDPVQLVMGERNLLEFLHGGEAFGQRFECVAAEIDLLKALQGTELHWQRAQLVRGQHELL